MLFNGKNHMMDEHVYNNIHVCFLNKGGRQKEEGRKEKEKKRKRGKKSREGEETVSSREGTILFVIPALCMPEGHTWVLGAGGNSVGVNRASLLACHEISQGPLGL